MRPDPDMAETAHSRPPAAGRIGPARAVRLTLPGGRTALGDQVRKQMDHTVATRSKSAPLMCSHSATQASKWVMNSGFCFQASRDASSVHSANET